MWFSLFDSGGNPIDVVAYTDEVPWPGAADGFGPSLELPGCSIRQRRSNLLGYKCGPSEGLRASPTEFPLHLHRWLSTNAPTTPPTREWTNDYNNDGVGSSAADEFVEIYNTTDSAVDISGWNLDDDDVTNDNTFTFPGGNEYSR